MYDYIIYIKSLIQLSLSIQLLRIGALLFLQGLHLLARLRGRHLLVQDLLQPRLSAARWGKDGKMGKTHGKMLGNAGNICNFLDGMMWNICGKYMHKYTGYILNAHESIEILWDSMSNRASLLILFIFLILWLPSCIKFEMMTWPVASPVLAKSHGCQSCLKVIIFLTPK